MKCFCVIATIACLFGANNASATSVVADLTTDYDETGASTGIAGSASGTWSYWSDDDTDPLNGGLAALTVGLTGGAFGEGGDGFHGTGTIFGNCCGPMPLITDERIFDEGVPLPAGHVAIHPGQTAAGEGPQYLVLQFTATSALTDVAIAYSVEVPNGFSDGVDVHILGDGGGLLATNTGLTFVGSSFAGNLGAGESLYAVIGNGDFDNPGADQAWANLTIVDGVPEPASLVLLGFGLGGIALSRRRT